jgi:hypothetical protein
MTLLDYSFPVPSGSVFDQTIARDWYDGLTSGVTKSSHLIVAFKFDILAWGPSQQKRVFAFAPLTPEVFSRMVNLLKNQVEQRRPIWFPEWPVWQSGENARGAEIGDLLSTAGPPEYVVATDSMFTTLLAAKPLDSAARKLLPTTYDGIPSSDSFEYWREFLSLSEQ